MRDHHSGPLQLWGGIECTVNRVGDTYFDQIRRSGHVERRSDLDQIAALGITTLRYPVLWEHHPTQPIDWSWADERLEALRSLGIRPIVGLVHHGSGPPTTSLVDPDFPARLADFARAVAERYPWVTMYTPINEPLTTARFSGLYGHWYPHGRTDATFVQVLLTECRAITLAMNAIRSVTPTAQLVQTEDMGKTWSVPALAYQAAFENERRWLSFDLLSGLVGPTHALWSYLLKAGADPDALDWFADHPTPPDIMGINYYVTSERFLDPEVSSYPPDTHGGNGRDSYADVEAVRVRAQGIDGLNGIVRETWARYQRPLAITEVQLAGTREEQLRWLAAAWQTARALRNDGIDLRAITAWTLLGCYNWNSLVTREDHYYEPGAFDLRGGQLRPTALAHAIRSLARDEPLTQPWATLPGWWQRSTRLIYGWAIDQAGTRRPVGQPAASLPMAERPLLITGGTGTLAQAFARICELRGIPCQLLTRHDLDITNAADVRTALAALHPWAVVNAAGYVRVDDAEHDPEACVRINSTGPAVLAEVCAASKVRLVSFSSDLVFDGSQSTPYLEDAVPGSLNVYGYSKLLAEHYLQERYPDALMIRTSAFFGPWDSANFVRRVLDALTSGTRIAAADDWLVSPTYVPDLVHACLDLLIDGAGGIWHLANAGAMTWADLAREASIRCGLDPAGIVPCPLDALGLRAPRPRYSVLGSQYGSLLPTLEHALGRYVQEYTMDACPPSRRLMGRPTLAVPSLER
jgi:dTDP-4-dehydrorhamnose reductase